MYKLLCIVGLVGLLTVGSYAQKQARPSASASSNLQAQLQNTLDARNAHVGDEVILKTTQSATVEGVKIPKGTKLVGRVTDVQQRSKNAAASRIGLLFDQIQNHGQTTPITATIVSIVNTNTIATIDEPIDMGMSSSASSRTSTSNSGGGGLLGGVTNTVGSVVSSTTQTVGGVTNSAVQTVGGTTQTLGRTVNSLQISTSASGSAQGSSTLSSPGSNVRLEKGVTFGLNVQKSAGN
jgi:hypothetical protein